MTSFDGYDDDPFGEPLVDENGFYYEPAESMPTSGRHARNSIEDDLLAAIELVNTSKSTLGRALLNREEMLVLLEAALANVPEEIREARHALREREALMLEEQRKINVMIELAQRQRDQMVEQTEIVRQARLEAQQIVADAEAAARKMVNEHEDFLDMKLAEFEKSMTFLLSTVQRGRARLATQTLPEPSSAAARGAEFLLDEPSDSAPFDYDADIDAGL
jgi:hypothetical protein